ncbi:hypothetical protein Gotur_004583 [Gossypium turneri]
MHALKVVTKNARTMTGKIYEEVKCDANCDAKEIATNIQPIEADSNRFNACFKGCNKKYNNDDYDKAF